MSCRNKEKCQISSFSTDISFVTYEIHTYVCAQIIYVHIRKSVYYYLYIRSHVQCLLANGSMYTDVQ